MLRICTNWPTRLILVTGMSVLTQPSAGQLLGSVFTTTDTDTVPRFFHAAGTLPDGTVMITGGLGLNVFGVTLFARDEVSFFDPATEQITASYVPLAGGPAVRPTLLTPRSSHTQTTLRDGRVLITGGHINAAGTSPGTATDSVELFDPVTGNVSAGPPLGVARAMHTATPLADGRVVIAGGGAWQIFDPGTGSWSPNHSLQRHRTAHAAVLLPDFAGASFDDRVLLVGGNGSGPDTLEILDPATGQSALLAERLTIGVDDLAATRLPDGTVFIVGGQDGSTGDTVANTYLLDPVTDVLTAGPAVPNRAAGIADHQLARFGPYVYILGGEQQVSGADTVLDYAAVFDASTRQWLDDDVMPVPRDDFAIAAWGNCELLLIDGGVDFFTAEAPTSNCDILTVTFADACLLGDSDNDSDVDFRDFTLWEDCLTGPALDAPLGPAFVPFRCWSSDIDADGAVDAIDYAQLQTFADA